MLLAIDVGNTETVLGVFKGGQLTWHWRMATVRDRTADELALMFGGFLEQHGLSFTKQVTGVAIASGVPSVSVALRDMTERYFHFSPIVVEPGVKTGIPILIDNPREVGPDRVVNSLAAFAAYGGPSIVVDFGTATNFDVVSAKGEYIGGAIAPGIQISAESLTSRAARLPRIEIVAPKAVIGKNTIDAMQSGLVWGTVSEIEGMIERIEEELEAEPTVVATGGLAEVIVPLTDMVDHHEPWLTLEGLRLVFERNAGSDE
ncbi:MAG: type III pantothenate kinase [Actinomycetota bacterium]